MFRFLLVAGIATVLSVSGALGLVRDPGPDGAADVLGAPALSLGAGPTAELGAQVASLQARLERLPGDGVAWAALGLSYVEQARVTGDPAFYTKADQAIDRSRAVLPEDNAVADAAAAALAGARHDFAEALARADAALRVDPFQPHALAVRVDALTELGRYPEQLRALRVADRRQPGVAVAARYSYALELRGDLAGAARVLRGSLDSAGPADSAFLLALLADLDRRRGLLDASATALRAALREAPGYVPALAARARLAVARGDLDTATSRWEQVVAIMPLPEYLGELGELYEHLGRADEAERQYDVVLTTARALGSGGVNTDLEVALFEADHGDADRAVKAARAEWGRRTSVHTADVLGWALHRSGDDRAALPFARSATRLGTQESRLWLHRGQIEADLGLEAAARRDLRRGLDADPGTSPWLAAQARATLEQLGARR